MCRGCRMHLEGKVGETGEGEQEEKGIGCIDGLVEAGERECGRADGTEEAETSSSSTSSS